MDRRQLLANSPMLFWAVPKGRNGDKGLLCSAPDDVIVERLLVSNAEVKTGQDLAILRSIALDRFRSRLSTIQGLIEIQERQFIDGRADQLLAVLKEEAEAATIAVETTKRSLEQEETVDRLGLTTNEKAPSRVNQARAEAANAVAAELSARIALEHEPKRVQDARERLGLIKKQLQLEGSYLNSLAEQMTIRAPGNGTFVAAVGEKGFVEKGSPVGALFYA